MICPFGSEVVSRVVHLLCLQKLKDEKNSIAEKFRGVLAASEPIPEETVALACSLVSNYNYIYSYNLM